MTATALIHPALVVLALAAAYAIVCMAILVAEQRRIIDALEADARRTSETLAERNLTVESLRMTLLDQCRLIEQLYARNTLIEQLVSRWIMSRPVMTAARVTKLGRDSAGMN